MHANGLLGLLPLRLLILYISVGAVILLYCFCASLTGVRAFWEITSISATPESYELCFLKLINVFIFFFAIDGNSVAILEFLHIKKLKQVLPAIKSEILSYVQLSGFNFECLI